MSSETVRESNPTYPEVCPERITRYIILHRQHPREGPEARSGNYHVSIFVPERGVTQGGIISPIIFNILVDAVVQKWYADVMEDMTSAITGLEGAAIRDRASLFYADDGAIGSRDPEWL